MPDKGVACHWSVNDPPADHTGCVALVDQIARLHASKGSTGHTFYNWLYCNHGQRLKGRGWERQSGANGTSQANRDYWACCWLGGPGHTPSQAAFAVLAGLIVEAPGASVARPHSDFYATSCPGPDLTAFARGFSPAQAPPTPKDDDMPKRLLIHAPGSYAIYQTDFTREGTDGPLSGPMLDQLRTPIASALFLVNDTIHEQPQAVVDYLTAPSGVLAAVTSGFARLFAWLPKLFPKKAERAGTP